MTTFRLNPPNSYNGIGRPWYDTKEGVLKAIESLNGFLHLRQARYTAAYVNKEDLNQLYVLGDYLFDTCGNCAVAQPSIKKKHQNIPDVMTYEEYWTYIRVNSTDKEMLGICFAYDQHIPSESIICPECKLGWNINNISDVVAYRTDERFNLENFIGKTLKEVKDFYHTKTDANYFIGGEPFLHNDRFIDLSPWTDNPKSEFEKTMVKNQNGWVGTKDGITDEYMIQTGDIINLSIVHYYHSDCNSKHLESTQLKSFQDIFSKAGFLNPEFTAIPNEYSNYNKYAPWFEVKTEIGLFKIGWRKRVINIEWPDLYNKNIRFGFLFDGENVTKNDDGIHAWGVEKSIEYLSKILVHCKNK